MKLLLFGLINLIAAALSGAAGGGGGLISLPLLVTLGLSPTTAIATGKFGGFGISLGSSVRFFREKLVDRRTIRLFMALGAVAAAAGSFGLLALRSHEQLLENVMGIVILVVGIPLLYLKNLGLKPVERSLKVKAIGSGLLFVTAVLTAALGSGLGIIQFIILMTMFGMTALTASATRRAMQLVIGLVTLMIFIAFGVVDYKYGLVGLITSALGGFIGAHIAVKKGNKFVVNLFAITSALLALQLLWR